MLLPHGLKQMIDFVLRGQSVRTGFKCLLVTEAPATTNTTVSELYEIPNGNGYTAGTGISVAFTDFDSLTEDDTADRASIQIVDLTFAASGGSIPVSGEAPTHIVLADSNDNLIAYEALGQPYVLDDGEQLQIVDFEIGISLDSGQAEGFTNRGAYRLLEIYFTNTSVPGGFALALCTDAVTPTVDTNTLSELTEITAADYTAGGVAIARSTGGWDAPTNTSRYAETFSTNVNWNNTTGRFPTSGNAIWGVLVDDAGTPNALGYTKLGSSGAYAETGFGFNVNDIPFRLRVAS